ncbi:MAG: glycosyltransferase [Bacilli bacterium]|nr:glycosyltransferase [Bacilli bacterium]
MNKYKVCVYAISKNEEKFVKRWFNSVKEADDIYVLDTGSTDNTKELLEKLGVHVSQIIFDPFRFDKARNESLKLVPNDAQICVCCDLDEVFLPGWREKLETIWQPDTTRLAYNYNWRVDREGKPEVNFYIEKIHSRHGYIWKHPVHEVLYPIDNFKENKITTDEIILNHYPDDKKSRRSYLKLLELSVKEDPENDRNMHYLGREYMYYGKWNEAIDTLIKHLSLKSATWKDERCASMRFIARCYGELNRIEEARMWLDKAIKEAPYLRDPYMERAILEYNEQNFKDVEKYCLKALKIKSHEKTYINEIFSWNNTVYDLLSVSEYYLNKFDQAYKHAKMALNMNPNDERIKNNLRLIEGKIKRSS